MNPQRYPVRIRHVSDSLCENDPKSVWCFSRAEGPLAGEGVKVDPQHWYPTGSLREMEELADARGFVITEVE